jgi:hypothetical protein
MVQQWRSFMPGCFNIETLFHFAYEADPNWRQALGSQATTQQKSTIALLTVKHGEAAIEPIKWCVRHRLPRTGAGLLLGQWGMFKSFWMLDLTAHVILGWDWLGQPVYRQCGVLALAPEGGSSIATRFAALLEHKLKARVNDNNLFDPAFPPIPIDIERMPFEWTNSCPLLLGKGDPLPTLIATARAAHERFMTNCNLPLGLIWMDTMSTSAGWKNEDDNAEAARAMAILRDLSNTMDAVVVGVDHFGKNKDAGARGASAKEANSDSCAW